VSPSESVHTAQAVSLAYVGLGANLGSPVDALRQALVAIRALPDTWLVEVSSPYRTAPLQASGPDFVNAVAELRTRLEPEVLLQHLLTIEQAHGRQRPYRNAPRTLDLDLLLYGDSVLNTESLILPHPRLHQRQFVLIPLLELNPQMHIAGLGAVRELSGALSDQAIERLDESLFP
jgi:2-amino-4-hydroxy-6-hydroxymethyldihydropteridine diphosphokinase